MNNGKCPKCGREGEQGKGCPTCPGFWHDDPSKYDKMHGKEVPHYSGNYGHEKTSVIYCNYGHEKTAKVEQYFSVQIPPQELEGVDEGAGMSFGYVISPSPPSNDLDIIPNWCIVTHDEGRNYLQRMELTPENLMFALAELLGYKVTKR